MAFTILNQADAGIAAQAELDSVDFDILAAALNARGVVTGCAVTAQGTPNMTVAVAAGTVLIDGVRVAVTGANGTIGTADASNPRFDLISINSSGTIVVTAGTAAARPVFPAIPANSAVLATVHVPANDTAIQTAQITDKRAIVGDIASGGVQDDILLRLGTTGDIALVLRSTALGADTALTNVVEGTADTLATAANSLILSNTTNDGDIHIVVSKGGNTHTAFLADGSTGDTILNAATGRSVDMYVAGTKVADFSASGLDLASGDVFSIGGSQVMSASALATTVKVSVAGIANGTDGELITWGTDGAPATVAVGTATHVLTSNGGGQAPTFQAPAAPRSAASQGAIEDETAEDTFARPDRLKHMHGAAKTWVQWSGSGVNESYNTTGVTEDSTGVHTWTITTAFGHTNWALVGATVTGIDRNLIGGDPGTGSVSVETFAQGGSNVTTGWAAAGYGEQ